MAATSTIRNRPGGTIEACALLAALAGAQAASPTAIAHRAIGVLPPASLPSSFRQMADAVCRARPGGTSSPPSLPWRFSLPYAALA